jgi:hypothetical protein
VTGSTTSRAERGSAGTWVMLLAGPVIWYGYFWLVYLMAEGVCRLGGPDFTVMGLTGLSWLTIAMTVGASALTIISGHRSYSSWRDKRVAATGSTGLSFAGFVLSGIFLFSVLATGLPALVLEPC